MQPIFSDTVYNFLRALVQFVLPALGTLYFTLAAIWGLAYAEQIVGTLAAIATFLGVLLAIGRRSYYNSLKEENKLLEEARSKNTV